MKKLMKMLILLLVVVGLIIGGVFLYDMFGIEKFKVINYDKSSNYSGLLVETPYKPTSVESYWVEYDKNVVYATKYLFDSAEASSSFSKDFVNSIVSRLTMIGMQNNTMKDYSFNKYSGYSFFDGQNYDFFLLKDKAILMFSGNYAKTTEKVVEWFIGKYG